MRERSRKLTLEFLDEHRQARRILFAAATDTSALGAVDAARERGREKHVAVVGQDCIEEALAEMQRKNSPLIGSVSHEISSYGPGLMQLGLSLLRGQMMPPYNYVAHRLVRREALSRG